MLSRCSQGLQILLPNMTARILVFEIWRFLRFFKKFSENLTSFFVFNFWNSQPCSWGAIRVIPRGCEPCLILWLLESLSFSRFEITNPVVGGYQSILRGLRTLPPVMIAQVPVVFEIWRFLWFLQKLFKNVSYFFPKIWSSLPCS